jgi:hypothetical protein
VQSRFNLSGEISFTTSGLLTLPEHPTSPFIQGLYNSVLITSVLPLLGESYPSFGLVEDI